MPLPCNDPTAAFWRKMMIGVLVTHFALIILDFICLSWWNGILDILAFSIGYCSIKDEGQYEVSRLLCYVMFMIFDFVFAGVAACLFFSGVSDPPFGSRKNWQWYAFAVLSAGGTAFYIIGGTIAYRLYKSLKRYFEGGEGQEVMDPGAPPAGYGGYQPVPNRGDPESGAVGSPGTNPGFKAFSGQGHTLGARSAQSSQPRAPPSNSGSNQRARANIPAAALDRFEQKSRAKE
eukprot:CAMPEP_0114498062 /NCGR_PEP_ID=MMETSP0109-20121206/6673_1 /TAXON_ID=29199 /ORGANISM="Chlorarachnion reptans, Strain CCCM449" /LENGTH=232 /DNA_ID=CAMNT_0001675517 /DNA_START=293 /DNA_END=991 /DNA_ORIENTATION=+